jgi:cyclic beta-1,2-glucan synthetase
LPYISAYSRSERPAAFHSARLGLLLGGEREDGYAVLDALLPGARDASVYRAEPYVLPADVYSNAQHRGRGGWTWYTGASGWFLRVTLEALLGVEASGETLRVNPRLPQAWDGYTLRLRRNGREYEITVRRGEAPEINLIQN